MIVPLKVIISKAIYNINCQDVFVALLYGDDNWIIRVITCMIRNTCSLTTTSKLGELWSPARQQLWPWRRSKVKVTAWGHLKGLVTRIMHAKYQCSIFNNSEDMSQVKVFVTDRRRDRRTNEIYVPTLSRKRGTIRIISRNLANRLVGPTKLS